MRIISALELDHVSGGDGATVTVTGHYLGGTNATLGTDFSAFTNEDTAMEANSGNTVAQAGKAVLAVAVCKVGIDKVKKSPTVSNALLAASACSTAAQDVIKALDMYGKNNPDFVRAMTVKPVL